MPCLIVRARPSSQSQMTVQWACWLPVAASRPIFASLARWVRVRAAMPRGPAALCVCGEASPDWKAGPAGDQWRLSPHSGVALEVCMYRTGGGSCPFTPPYPSGSQPTRNCRRELQAINRKSQSNRLNTGVGQVGSIPDRREGGERRSSREGPWRRHGLQARGARAREGSARGRTDPVDGTACGRAVRRGHLEKAWRGDAS